MHTFTQTLRRNLLGWLPYITAGCVIGLGLLDIIGWQFEIEVLYGVIHGLPPMVPNTALGFILSGGSLLLLANMQASPLRVSLGQVLAVATFTLGVTTLSEYSNFISPLSIDRLLVALFSNEPFVLRPSPQTSLAFACVGIALFLLGNKKKQLTLLVQWLSLMVLLIGVMVLFGYIYGEITIYTYSDMIGMAVHTASGFILLALGIALVNPEAGLLRVITSNTAGGMVMRRLFPAIVLVPLTLGALVMLGRKAGWYTEHFGTALLQSMSVIAMAIIITHVVGILNREEKLKKRAEMKARQDQADLAHLHRLNTMSEMASGIAHEVNQPLTAISTYAYTCKRLLKSQENIPPDVLNSLEKIDAATHLAADIIRHMREFVQNQRSDKSRVVLKDLINEAVKFVDDHLRSNYVQLQLLIDEPLPPVEVDAIQIEQVILNLVRNAVEALESEVVVQKHVMISAYTNPAQDIQVDICDSGPGIEPELLNNIFDSFFTTKGTRGMGMGLSISRSIIESHGGRIWAESTPGQGSCFSFTLPCNK